MEQLVSLLALLFFPIFGAIITGFGVRGLVKSEIRWNRRETLLVARAIAASAFCIIVGVVHSFSVGRVLDGLVWLAKSQISGCHWLCQCLRSLTRIDSSTSINETLLGRAWFDVFDRVLSFGNLNGESSSTVIAGLAKHWQSQWHPSSPHCSLHGITETLAHPSNEIENCCQKQSGNALHSIHDNTFKRPKSIS